MTQSCLRGVVVSQLHQSSLSFPTLQWHSLSREEQAKYYELARKERQLHSQLYPTWSARDNYVSNKGVYSVYSESKFGL